MQKGTVIQLILYPIPFGKHLNGFIYQHDNDPKHTAKTVKAYQMEKYTVELYQCWICLLKARIAPLLKENK